MLKVLLLLIFRVRWVVFGLNFSGSMFMLIRLVWWMCLKFLVMIVFILVRCMFLVV